MVAVLTAVAVSAVWCALLPFLGPRLGFVDQPDGDDLKVHRQAAVPLGGPGLLLGALLGLGLIQSLDVELVIGLSVLTALGVVDDRFQLAPVLRLGVEVVAAVILATRWSDEGGAAFAFGVVLIVVAVNAVNLYDGVDMLAGTTGAVGLVVMAWVIGSPGHWLPLLTAAALAGFLPFNRHPARVFLGDGGAYLVGGVSAVALWDIGVAQPPAGAVAALGLLGLFAVDLVVTLGRRVVNRSPLFQGDRSHVYDVMLADGLSVWRVIPILVAGHLAITGGTALALHFLPAAWAVAVALFLAGSFLALAWQRVARHSAAASG